MPNSKNQSLSKRTRLLLICVALLSMILASIYPVETTVVPAWTLNVVNEDGNIVAGALVREHWKHYSIESTSHEQDLRTDQDGQVTFPARTIRASLLSRILGPIVNRFTEGVHAGVGPHAYVVALDKGSEGEAVYTPGESLPVQLVLRARNSG
jgi:hypothetical protein